MNPKELRDASVREAKRLGAATNPNLPLPERSMRVRNVEEVVSRTLTLNVVVSTAFGYDARDALEWLDREDLLKLVPITEASFLRNLAELGRRIGADEQREDIVAIQDQVEALNALAWSLGYVYEIPFDRPCSDDLVTKFPNLKSGESSSAFQASACLRPVDQIVQALDLSYCLHWALVESSLSRREGTGRLDPIAVVERRRALEWLTSVDDWEDIDLDT